MWMWIGMTLLFACVYCIGYCRGVAVGRKRAAVENATKQKDRIGNLIKSITDINLLPNLQQKEKNGL